MTQASIRLQKQVTDRRNVCVHWLCTVHVLWPKCCAHRWWLFMIWREGILSSPSYHRTVRFNTSCNAHATKNSIDTHEHDKQRHWWHQCQCLALIRNFKWKKREFFRSNETQLFSHSNDFFINKKRLVQ